jgi:hypothetical protein
LREARNMTVRTEGAVVEEMTAVESRAAFNAQVSDRLSISGREFLERLDRGDYDNTDSEDVVRLRILAAFGR